MVAAPCMPRREENVKTTKATPTRPVGSASKLDEFISVAGLKDRGWTDSGVRRFLGDCDRSAENPIYKCAAPMRLYSMDRAKAVEVTDEFQNWREASERRRESELKSQIAEGEKLDYGQKKLLGRITTRRSRTRAAAPTTPDIGGLADPTATPAPKRPALVVDLPADADPEPGPDEPDAGRPPDGSSSQLIDQASARQRESFWFQAPRRGATDVPAVSCGAGGT